jgi:GPH family glycoside/pentoside/hexuronide:cation symporter
MYYFKYFIENTELAAGFMVLGLLAAMAGAASTGPLTARFGKRVVMNGSIVVGIVSSAAIYLLGPTSIVALFVLSAITEFSTGPVIALFFVMLGDAADYSEWRNYRRATGLVFSAGTLSLKFGSAVAAAASGWILAWFGYVANVDQSAESLMAIRLLFSVVPALAGILLLVIFRQYPLTANQLRQIELDLADRAGNQTG